MGFWITVVHAVGDALSLTAAVISLVAARRDRPPRSGGEG